MSQATETITAGGAILARLKAVGVDYIFANSGTDFPPIIEGLAEAAAKDIALPRAIVIPHEHAAMGMAHGYYLATGRAQAVMAHTNAVLRPDADAGTGAAGRSDGADRLGAGDARPDGFGARGGEVGLRTAVSGAGGGGGGPGLCDCVLDAAGTGLR
jgi:hypothetical protein